MVQIIPSVYTSKYTIGDFPWMIQQTLYKNSLFIFDERIEFINSYKVGNGNAGVRPYSINNPEIIKPLAAGIPLASIKKGGFSSMSGANKAYIDDAINSIKTILGNFEYDNIYFAARNDNKVAISNYAVSADVRNYITQQINDLVPQP